MVSAKISGGTRIGVPRPTSFLASSWKTSPAEKRAYRKLVSATAGSGSVEVSVMVHARPAVRIAECGEGRQVQAPCGGARDLDLHRVALRDAHCLQDAEGQGGGGTGPPPAGP